MTDRDEEAIAMTGATERLLTQAFGGPVVLGTPENLREKYRNRVLRCPVVEGPAGLPSSVIVKAAVGEGESAYDAGNDQLGSTAWRLTNEWAGNLFLNTLNVTPPLNARLLGGDRNAGLFVLEDLGNGHALSDKLTGTDLEAAEAALIAYARGLGSMHARTLGQGSAWHIARQAVGGTEQEREREGARWLREDVPTFREQCVTLDVPLASGFEEEVEAVRQTLDNPGPFDAFSPNDTCPDNHRLMPDGTLRFFDFEWAGFRHALLDAAYMHLPFPTCWCVNRLPAGLASRMEDAYRAELAPACPPAQEDAVFYRAMNCACAYWTITTLSWQLKSSLEADGKWGIASVRQRHVYRLETFIGQMTRFGNFPALTETARRLAARLAALWPDLEPIPLYPAFRGD